jgi:hypothetical protein
MSNELREMQEYLRQHDAKRGPTMEDMIDDEGFASPAPAPPTVTGNGEQVLSSPKEKLEQYQSANYPPKVIAIDLEAMRVVGSHGKFELEEEERKQIVAIAIRSMQRAYEKILQTLVENAGLAGDQTAKDTVAQDPQDQTEGVASTTPRSTKSRTKGV